MLALSDLPVPVLREAARAAIAKKSFADFVKHAWPFVEPDKELLWNWHIDALCNILERLTDGTYHKVLCNVPPGTMKSLLVSVMWPAWSWARQPGTRILAASYSSDLSIRDNLRFKAIVTSAWYRDCYGVQLSSDQSAKERLNNTAGGWRIATSVGGVGTGEHPDIIIIDDPHTAEQARSDAERQRALDWMDRTIASRGKVRDVKTIVIMQRLNERDLSGHLLDKGGWEHVCWPMRYDPDRDDADDPREMPGELFWPALYPEAKVRELELDLGPYGTAGQLQQRPAPEGGGLFKRDWFAVVEAMPADLQFVRGWDTAATEGAGDYTVGVKMGWQKASGLFYVADVQRGQLSDLGVDRLILRTAETDGTHCRIREEREGGSSGKTVVAHRTRRLVGYDYRGVTVDKAKDVRAGPFRAQCEAGNVKLLHGAWNEAYLQELCSFPVGQHDDQVDASSCAFNELALKNRILVAAVMPTRRAFA